jgi:hypothetical protein
VTTSPSIDFWRSGRVPWLESGAAPEDATRRPLRQAFQKFGEVVGFGEVVALNLLPANIIFSNEFSGLCI